VSFLGDLLFGSKPKTKSYYADPDRIMSIFQQMLGGMEGQLGDIGKRALGGAASFGPGFQGNTGMLAQRAVMPYLARIMEMATGVGTPTMVQTPGSSGLVQTALSGLMGGAGIGLGAKLFGGDSPDYSNVNQMNYAGRM
jgi:hypothetical protein